MAVDVRSADAIESLRVNLKGAVDDLAVVVKKMRAADFDEAEAAWKMVEKTYIPLTCVLAKKLKNEIDGQILLKKMDTTSRNAKERDRYQKKAKDKNP